MHLLPADGYANLTPPAVLEALDTVGLRGDGRLLQLNSYENRVFQVFLEDGRVVVAKFYRPGRWSDAQILDEHAFALELAAREIPVVPPMQLDTPGGPQTLAEADIEGHGHRFSVSERRAGRAPELDDTDTLRWLGRFIGRVHEVGAMQPFAHRRRLDPASFGVAARDLLLERELIPPAQLPAWQSVCDAALALAQRRFDEAAPLRTLRLHGDCHPGNVLWRDEGPHVVDLDDACNGPAMQDLWMLLSGDASARAAQLRELLAGYRQFMRFDERELALIEPLRTLRMIHHSAWIAERWTDPAFPVAFPWFGTAAYWSQQTTHLREQLEAMSEPPLQL
ncbi:MAG TPA: serine/threonine protein kinase [Burkholderiaceae bacterium]